MIIYFNRRIKFSFQYRNINPYTSTFLLFKNIVHDRNKSIKNDEESVSKNASDTGNYEAQIEKIIGDARAEAQAKKHAALSEAKERAATKVAIKKESLEADFDSFMAGLADRKAELKSNLTAKIPELKSTLAGSLSKM